MAVVRIAESRLAVIQPAGPFSVSEPKTEVSRQCSAPR